MEEADVNQDLAQQVFDGVQCAIRNIVRDDALVVEPSMALDTELGLDSLDLVSLALDIEQRWSVMLPKGERLFVELRAEAARAGSVARSSEPTVSALVALVAARLKCGPTT